MDQRFRLALERKILLREMPHVMFHNPTGDTYVEGEFPTSARTSEYRLRVLIPPDYPDGAPRLIVAWPETLWKHGDKETVNSVGATHAFHTRENVRGRVQICHRRAWDPATLLFGVFLRGIGWLEAYELHRRTGRDLAAFLPNSQD